METSGKIDLRGKAAIVTGGGGGIGAAICRALAREGCNVAVVDVLDTAETVAAVRSLGAAAIGLGVEVTERRQVEDMIRATIGRFGRIDILVNSAGTDGSGDLETTDDPGWERDTGAILQGTYLCTQAVYPLMKAQGGGKIVNVVSIAGKIGGFGSRGDGTSGETSSRPGPAAAAAEGGVITFTRWVARDGGRYGVYANAVCSGVVKAGTSFDRGYETASQPLSRVGRPEDVAEAVVFLASNAANFITGQTINVDGGMVLE